MNYILNFDLKEFSKGALVGISQALVGHPFDTIKTIRQNKKNLYKMNMSKMIPRLYSGVKYPTLGNLTIQSMYFGINEYFYRNYTQNHYVSGFITGTICSCVVSPIEYFKVRKQVFPNQNPLIKNMFRGFWSNTSRESVATSIYFGCFFYLKDNRGWHPFISGATTGLITWIGTYPIDTIKTRVQSDHRLSILDAIRMRNIWKGFSYCAIRAVLVNGISFYLYDKMRNL